MKKGIICAVAALCLPAMLLAGTKWRPAGNNLQTEWTRKITPANCHREYPRPQMVRNEWRSLNGLWDYRIRGAQSDEMGQEDGQILVPFAVESSLSGVGRRLTADEALWYRRSFTVPASWKDDRILMHFDAVDWECEIYVNGIKCGSHTGGYDAFAIDVTSFLHDRGEQIVTVKVKDATDNDRQPRGKQVSDPGSIWYTPVSGIWQSVWLEPVSMTAYISDYNVSSDIVKGTLTVTPECVGARPDDIIKVELLEGRVGYDSARPSGKVIASTTGRCDGPITVMVPDPQLWSPERPFLYGLKLTLMRKGGVFGRTTRLDAVQAYSSLRSISVVKDAKGYKRMALNGSVLFQFGPLDQGFWPDGIYTAPTDDALKFDIEQAKSLGFNMIRKHIKVEPSRWYYWCDVIGMLVWQDMPSITDSRFGKWSVGGYEGGIETPFCDEVKQNWYSEWGRILDQLRKFQCIVVWVPFNEAWGQFDTVAAAEFTRKNGGDRLINAASGGNFVKGAGDIIDAHNYPHPWPGFWDTEMVNVLGEYGGIGLPVKGHLWQKDRNWGYIEYKDGNEVTATYCEYIQELLCQLDDKGTCAAVYTQITDVEGEVNGLMTYDRKVLKVDRESIAAANRSVIEALK